MKTKDVAYQEQKQLKQSIRGKPKYVDKLIKEAEKRKHQHDLWYEKKLQRELEAEKAAFGETEKFVTPSYLRHLEQVKAYEKQQKEEEEQNEAALKKRGMQGFFSNMLGFATGQVETPSKNEDEPPTKRQAVESKEATPDLERLQPQLTDHQAQGLASGGGEMAAEIKNNSGRSKALDLSNAVGVRDLGADARARELEELNKSAVTDEKQRLARERYLARKNAAK